MLMTIKIVKPCNRYFAVQCLAYISTISDRNFMSINEYFGVQRLSYTWTIWKQEEYLFVEKSRNKTVNKQFF